MKSILIEGEKRKSLGKKSTKELRSSDVVPCVVYGKGDPIHFSVPEKKFKNLVYTPDAHTVELKIDGGASVMTILKDIQFHAVTDRILHADFYMLDDKKPISIEVPVRLEGRSRGVLNGGSLRFAMRRLIVNALPKDLPDEIVINIEELRIGQKTTIADIQSDKFSLMHPNNAVVVAVKVSRNSVEEMDEEEGEVAEATETKEASTEAK